MQILSLLAAYDAACGVQDDATKQRDQPVEAAKAAAGSQPPMGVDEVGQEVGKANMPGEEAIAEALGEGQEAVKRLTHAKVSEAISQARKQQRCA